MIFITGGIGSGKRGFVLDELGFAEEELSRDPGTDAPVLLDFHELIREKGPLENDLRELLLKKEVVVCDEVGCGVVPIGAEERAWRDDVGRAATSLAREASVVVRMVCGLPQVVKGTLEGGRNA